MSHLDSKYPIDDPEKMSDKPSVTDEKYAEEQPVKPDSGSDVFAAEGGDVEFRGVHW